LLRALFKQLVFASNVFVKRVVFFHVSLRKVGKAHALRRLRQFAPMNFLELRCLSRLLLRKLAPLRLLPLQEAPATISALSVWEDPRQVGRAVRCRNSAAPFSGVTGRGARIKSGRNTIILLA
jgi:hypothetical protein